MHGNPTNKKKQKMKDLKFKSKLSNKNNLKNNTEKVVINIRADESNLGHLKDNGTRPKDEKTKSYAKQAAITK